MLNQRPAQQRVGVHSPTCGGWLRRPADNCRPAVGRRNVKHASTLGITSERSAVIAGFEEEPFARVGKAGVGVNRVVAVGDVAKDKRRLLGREVECLLADNAMQLRVCGTEACVGSSPSDIGSSSGEVERRPEVDRCYLVAFRTGHPDACALARSGPKLVGGLSACLLGFRVRP